MREHVFLAAFVRARKAFANWNRQVLASVKYAPAHLKPPTGIWWRTMPNLPQSLGWTAAAAVVLWTFTSIEAGNAEQTPRIEIATKIFAEPDSQTAMVIRLAPPQAVPPNSFIRLRGLLPTVSLTEGFAIGPGVWAVPLFGLATLNANVPVGVSGQSTFVVTLVDVEGTILAEAASAFVVGPAPAHQEEAATPSVGVKNKAFSYRPASHIPPMPQLAELSEARVEKLLARGESHLAHGNIASAREFFRHVAEAGIALGATLLAVSYDPVELQRLKVVGVVADRNEARKWYQRARELGAQEDPSLFTRCKC